MSQLKVQGNGGGTGVFTIASPNSNNTQTLTLPDGTGTFTVNGVNSNIVSGTAVASTSGTSIDFTGIPSWVKRITVMFNGVSTNGTSNPIVQLGAGSITTSGYVSSSGSSDGAGTTTATSGFVIRSAVATNLLTGNLVFCLLGSNIWTSASNIYNSAGAAIWGAGGVTLSGTLDRVRITTVNGTDTFDAGSINILYE